MSENNVDEAIDGVLPTTSCSAGWLPPESAPKNETCIIGNFGWPWPVMAIWCLVQEGWAVAQIAPCSEDEGRGWETEWESHKKLKGWMPLPSLPNVQAMASADTQTPKSNGQS